MFVFSFTYKIKHTTTILLLFGPSALVKFYCLDYGHTLVFYGGIDKCLDSFVGRCLQCYTHVIHDVGSISHDWRYDGRKQPLFRMYPLKTAFGR